MPKVVSRLSKEIKVKDGNGKIPIHQSLLTLGYDSQFTIPIQNSVSKSALSNATQIYFDIDENECGKIDMCCFKWTIRAINDTYLSPVFYWARELELRAQRGVGEVLNRIYSFSYIYWLWTCCNEEERKEWANLSNFTIVKDLKTGRESIDITEKNLIPAGTTKDIYMPIPCSFLQNGSIDCRHLTSEFRFQFEMSGDVAIKGTSNNDFELENIQFIVNSYIESISDTQSRLTNSKREHNKTLYLDCERLTYNDRNLQSNSRQRFNLDQFQNKMSFMVCVIKPNGNPNSQDSSDWTFCEGISQIDFENSGGKSLYGNGNPVKSREIFTKFVHETGNNALKGVYTINFSNSQKEAILCNCINGYFQFDGSNYYISLEFKDEAVGEQQRINGIDSITNGSAGVLNPLPNGAINLVINGKTTGTISLNSANIQNILDTELPKYGIKNATVNGDTAIVNGGNIVISFDPKDGDIYNKINSISAVNSIPPINTSLNPIYFTDEIFTQGKDGWVSGSSYQLEIYAYKWKELLINKNGTLTCREL